jgi:hypothetical protein
MTDATIERKRQQVADQCRVVAHLCAALAQVCREQEAVYRGGHADQILDIVGERTARQMELLGNELNNMDAVDDAEDAWMDPIFDRAHEMFPVEAMADEP